MGSICTVAILIAVNLLDTTINSEEYLTQAYGELPLLAVVPDAENPKSGSGYRGYYESQRARPAEEKKGGTK